MQFSYQLFHQTGELKRRAEIFKQRLQSCVICPRHCEADRMNEIEGFCRSGRNPLVASTVAHFGEEPALVGKNGAGNIFFGSCNLRCVYCQNWQISQPRPISPPLRGGDQGEGDTRVSPSPQPSPLKGEGDRL
ncbi:MAG: hypothetical protein HY541_06580 [Deltaproteobacteria bacterium]|nr:hypothetical protein [Deltaproteobacteria bacterium]